ncbi:FabD/lysophospholipase-like protein [Lizonia empirigonia]|nr:FabD/lysophospholipase-like protein [Lizonia empirigonia]
MDRYSRRDVAPCVRLQLDPNTSSSSYPTFLAYSQIPNKVVLAQEPVRNAPCHYNTLREGPWLSTDPAEAFEDLHRRLLLPLADVICLFAPDRDGLQSVATRIVSWSAAERHALWHPRVVVVCAAAETRSPAEVRAELIECTKSLSPCIDLAIFSHISLYVDRRDQTLKDHIRIETDLVRNARIQTRSLFSAAHLDRLFRHACDHFVSTENQPFDPIAASRLHRPVSRDIGPCIADVLTDVDSMQELTQLAVPFIAECLLLDNYSPDVHGFDPADVFRSQYRKGCVAGVPNISLNKDSSAGTTILLRAKLAQLIEKEFCPEQDPNLYSFAECPICAVVCEVKIRIRPATAGVRVLSLDGGGIRAKIPLQFLRALEHAIGIDLPVQEHFEFGYGTSSGSMVILALYGLGMRVEEADKLFTELAMRVFRGRDTLDTGLLAPLISLTQGQFPATDIDGCLTEIFGTMTMLKHPYMTALGARIGFPVVDVNTSETCLVTSYNGFEEEQDPDARPVYTTHSIHRARCASAAPCIPGHGTYVDGGLSFNNPALLALQEAQRLAPAYPNPDQLVTVGTGTCMSGPQADPHSGFARILNRTSLGPALNHYQGSFDGTRLSNELHTILSIAGRDPSRWYRRFDLPVEGQLPDLADAGAMAGLANRALAHFTSNRSIDDLAMAILASNFYIKLKRMPVYENGLYHCYTQILSRISMANPGFQSMIRRLDSLEARFVVQGRLYKEPKPTILTTDRVGNFCKPVLFCVEELDKELDVQVLFPKAKSYGISANCMSVESLIERQRLDWVGVSDASCTDVCWGRKRHVLGKRQRSQQTPVGPKPSRRRRDSVVENSPT